MPLEIEKKYLDVDFDTLRNKLAKMNAETSGIHFESNIIFDFPQLALFGQKMLLRLRTNEWPFKTEHILTMKRPSKAENPGFKTREEIECVIDNVDALSDILHSLGLVEVARYEKIRQSYIVDDVHIDLDVVPFGNVVELEGNPKAITVLERALGLDKYQISSKSYHELHQQWRVQKRLDPDANLVFSPKIRINERHKIGLS